MENPSNGGAAKSPTAIEEILKLLYENLGHEETGLCTRALPCCVSLQVVESA